MESTVRSARFAAWILYCVLTACAFERGPVAAGARGADGDSAITADRDAEGEIALDGGDEKQKPTDAGASSVESWDSPDAETEEGTADPLVPATVADAKGDGASDAAIGETDAKATDGEPGAQDAALPPARFSTACSQDSDCRSDEACVRGSGPGAISYCSQSCSAASDCEAPANFPQPVCAGQGFGGQGRCRITCDFLVNQSCPGDMICQDILVIFPAGTGTCGFAN